MSPESGDSVTSLTVRAGMEVKQPLVSTPDTCFPLWICRHRPVSIRIRTGYADVPYAAKPVSAT